MLITSIVLGIFTIGAYRLQFVGQVEQSEPELEKSVNRDEKGRFTQNTTWIEDKAIINRFSY